MKYQDVIDIGLGNLWRMKLRTSLTLLGVIIAIGAFVSMLSLGAGMQEQVSQQFEQLGLFFNIQVYLNGMVTKKYQKTNLNRF